MTRAPATKAGDRFAHLTVISSYAHPKDRHRWWTCLCDCGKTKDVAENQLRRGVTKSCGHLRTTARAGSVSRTVEYRIWRGIIARCENKNVSSYPHYGGRGIRIAPEWRRDFKAFLAHLGPRPTPKHSVDRIEPDGHYEPGNVRWVLVEDQANNKRNTRHVVYRDASMPLNAAVRLAGSVIHYEAAWVRITHGWSVESALETPRTKESPNSRARKADSAMKHAARADLYPGRRREAA